MNRNTLPEHQASTPLAVDANPMPLRLPKGSAIFAHRGEVWITQEGMYDDVILAPGERFDVKSRELILASATRGSAYLIVAWPAHAGQCADRDFIAFLQCRARRMRNEQFDQAAQTVRRLLSGLVDFPDHVRRMLAPSTRALGR